MPSRLGDFVEVQARFAEEGRGLLVSIADRGPGVPEDSFALILEPFTRLHGSGSAHGVGLGLAIAHQAITLHGGRLVITVRLTGP